MSHVRSGAAFAALGAIVAVVACGSSSRPAADTEPTTGSSGAPAPSTDGNASTDDSGAATDDSADLYYPGCDPTEITDGAVGSCACYAPDAVTDAGGIAIELPCGFELGLCGGTDNDLTLCSTARQGVYFPNCPNIFTGPDGSANIPPCAPGTKPIRL